MNAIKKDGVSRFASNPFKIIDKFTINITSNPFVLFELTEMYVKNFFKL